ncbi:MAG TPA: YggT family protein [Pontiella sp.]
MWFARFVHYAFTFYELGLLAYVLSGWIIHPTARRIHYTVGRWYEPLLIKIRAFSPAPRIGLTVLDISPVILFVLIALVRNVLISLLVPPF